MAQSQTDQGLALQPVSVRKMHRLDSIHYHRVDCNEARGAALTKMVETDDDMDHYLKDVYCTCVG